MLALALIVFVNHALASEQECLSCVYDGMNAAGCNWGESCIDTVLETTCPGVCLSAAPSCTSASCFEECSNCISDTIPSMGCDSTKDFCVNFVQMSCKTECSDSVPTCDECRSGSTSQCAWMAAAEDQWMCQQGLCRQLCPGSALGMPECTQEKIAAGWPGDEWCIDYTKWLGSSTVVSIFGAKASSNVLEQDFGGSAHLPLSASSARSADQVPSPDGTIFIVASFIALMLACIFGLLCFGICIRPMMGLAPAKQADNSYLL